MVIPLLVFGQ
jgi:hypothetical protein